MELEQALQSVDDLMFGCVESDVAVLRDASRHIIKAGGKRVRPRILFLSYQAVGGDDLSSAIPVATAIELVHTATLVHDDINDHGIVRRGRETINELWGRTFALLTGDYLFAKVYELMAPYDGLNGTLAEATVALVEGETLQAAAVADDTLTRETYQQIVAKKTASLFRASAMLGAELAGADWHTVDALGEYGFFLGLAFQIVDDLLDLTGDAELMGKSAGIDLAQGKGVGAAIAHDSGNGHHYRPEMADEGAVVAIAENPDPYEEIKRRLITGGAVDEGHQMAQVLAAQANDSLDKLPQNVFVDELRDIISLVLKRDK
ncbi:MAG: polyprenyl synthetase family protein [Anaerolineae bacterium]|nr:polyprenyl synthetase family protein [Anaerolineae bacterium]